MVARNKRFQVEQLEGRQMMAGNVLAFMSSGNLNVVEAVGHYDRGQAVQIFQLSNGNIRVQGLYSQDGGTSLINGASYRDFTVPGNLIVNLAGGRDTVLVGRATASTFNNVSINTGVASAVGQADLDSISVEKVTTRQHLTIDSGASSDYINVLDTKVGDGNYIDNLSIYSGAGTDNINVIGYNRAIEVLGNVTIVTYNSSEIEADNVYMQTVFARDNLQAFLGAGNDRLEVLNGFAGRDAFFAADAGDDTLKMTEVRVVDDFWIYMGDGNDFLDMQYLQADVLTLDGGAGYDTLAKAVDGYVNQLVQTNWEVINGRRVNWYFNPDITLNNITRASF